MTGFTPAPNFFGPYANAAAAFFAVSISPAANEAFDVVAFDAAPDRFYVVADLPREGDYAFERAAADATGYIFHPARDTFPAFRYYGADGEPLPEVGAAEGLALGADAIATLEPETGPERPADAPLGPNDAADLGPFETKGLAFSRNAGREGEVVEFFDLPGLFYFLDGADLVASERAAYKALGYVYSEATSSAYPGFSTYDASGSETGSGGGPNSGYAVLEVLGLAGEGDEAYPRAVAFLNAEIGYAPEAEEVALTAEVDRPIEPIRALADEAPPVVGLGDYVREASALLGEAPPIDLLALAYDRGLTPRAFAAEVASTRKEAARLAALDAFLSDLGPADFVPVLLAAGRYEPSDPPHLYGGAEAGSVYYEGPGSIDFGGYEAPLEDFAVLVSPEGRVSLLVFADLGRTFYQVDFDPTSGRVDRVA